MIVRRKTASLATHRSLADGVALYLVGIAEVRRCLGTRSPLSRLVAAVAALATIPIGTFVHAGLQLAAVAAVVAAVLIIDARFARAKTLTHA